MHFSLPALDLEKLMTQRQETRTSSWESDFEKNHTIFAESLACGIAKQVIKDLENTIGDPYKLPIDSENKLVSTISLEITQSRKAKKISDLTEGCPECPPFHEWLTKFSTEKKDKDQHFFDENLKGVDEEYFQELMNIVGQLAEKKLSQLFLEFTSCPEQKDLLFKVEWYRKSDQKFSGPSSFRDNCLCIELWFKQKFIPQQIEKKSSGVIEQHRVQQKNLQNNRKKILLFAAFVVYIIGFKILSSGIFESKLPNSDL